MIMVGHILRLKYENISSQLPCWSNYTLTLLSGNTLTHGVLLSPVMRRKVLLNPGWGGNLVHPAIRMKRSLYTLILRLVYVEKSLPEIAMNRDHSPGRRQWEAERTVRRDSLVSRGARPSCWVSPSAKAFCLKTNKGTCRWWRGRRR